MASIDKYRPPREGYQPPAVPQNRNTSRSPSRRREVPPPAPSPPTHTSRTSPPRPRSRHDAAAAAAAPSPAPTAPQTPNALPPNQWYFTPDEVVSTPSIIDGISRAEERLRRAKGVNFIYQAGALLDLPQPTLWVAGVFFHRFYMRFSMVEEKSGLHHYNIAATSLFLANKTEENCRKTKDIIIAVARVAQKNARLVIDEQSKEYWRWRDSILMNEELMLEVLTFDLMIETPYRRLFELLEPLGSAHNKTLRQAAWAFCNDACLTSLPLLMDARDVALSAIFFASAHTAQPIDDVDGRPWWRYLGADEDACVRAIDVMRRFYGENPLRRQNPSLGSPPFLLESTRRRGEILMSQTPPHHSGGTPLNSESPRRHHNGEHAAGKASDGAAKESTAERGEAANGARSYTPAKRKDADSEVDEEGRPRKRQRSLSDGEEGEVVDT
ncbi:related to C-type cyclin [Cephalotrichum gorgonifer]|uniref:RNA polymerase II holoenzyme cyclin-like subunit n=1 Tax=Cephalotrichum gorgonifer TaxID=2041049 RepID=A0AAE8MR50_9PEZI|nr:related to C-type cyclin [Cephalotrichum gorgonifer]